jgi:hypothetical protein
MRCDPSNENKGLRGLNSADVSAKRSNAPSRTAVELWTFVRPYRMRRIEMTAEAQGRLLFYCSSVRSMRPFRGSPTFPYPPTFAPPAHKLPGIAGFDRLPSLGGAPPCQVLHERCTACLLSRLRRAHRPSASRWSACLGPVQTDARLGTTPCGATARARCSASTQGNRRTSTPCLRGRTRLSAPAHRRRILSTPGSEHLGRLTLRLALRPRRRMWLPRQET